MVRRELALDPILRLLVWASHDSSIIDQEVDLRGDAIYLRSSLADRLLGAQIERHEDHFDIWRLFFDLLDNWSRFRFGAASED